MLTLSFWKLSIDDSHCTDICHGSYSQSIACGVSTLVWLIGRANDPQTPLLSAVSTALYNINWLKLSSLQNVFPDEKKRTRAETAEKATGIVGDQLVYQQHIADFQGQCITRREPELSCPDV